jgi:hypothetical protein
MKPLLVIEDISPPMRRDLFTIVGVRVQATRYAWLALPNWIAVGVSLALLSENGKATSEVLVTGLFLGGFLYLANVTHSLGHVVAGWVVHSPMDILLLTATRDVTLYLKDRTAYPPSTRIRRSLGGPIANLVVGLAGLAMTSFVRSAWLELFVLSNVGVGLWTLCPVPTMDGWVIWSSLLRKRHTR